MKTKWNSYTVYENENGEKLYVEYNHCGVSKVFRNIKNFKRDKETAFLYSKTKAAYHRIYMPGNHKFTEAAEWANGILEDRIEELGYREIGLM